MRYVRYRFVLDDEEYMFKIMEILSQAMKRQKNVKGPVKMPSFYLKKDQPDQNA